jgi:tetratricopeptide (TPR) repeat protein
VTSAGHEGGTAGGNAVETGGSEPLVPYYLALAAALSRRGRHREAVDLLRRAGNEPGADQEVIGALLVDELIGDHDHAAKLTTALELIGQAPVAAARALASLRELRPAELPNAAEHLLDADWAGFAASRDVPPAVRADVVAAVVELLQTHQRFEETAALLEALPPDLAGDLRLKFLLGTAMDAVRQWPAALDVLMEAESQLSETTPAPLAASIWLLTATVHERMGNADRALPLLDPESMTSNATRAHCLALRALCLVQTGETASARGELAAASAHEIDSHAVHALVTWAVLGLGDAEAAASRAADGIRRYPDSEELPFVGHQAEIAAGGEIEQQVHPLSKLAARMHRADLDILLGRTRRVRSAGRADLHASAHYFMAVVARATGDESGARAAADQAIAGLAAVPAPNRPRLSVAARRLRAGLIQAEDPAGAAVDYAAAANAVFELGDWAGAVELFTEAYGLGRLDEESSWTFADALRIASMVPSAPLGVVETSLRESQRIWEDTFSQALPAVGFAWTYLVRGRIELGLAHLDNRYPTRALQAVLDGESALLLAALPAATAELYFEAARMLGLYALGAEVQEQALRAAPSDPLILDCLLTSAYNAGNLELARRYLPERARASADTSWRESAARMERLSGDPRASLDELARVDEARRSTLYFHWLEFVAYASLNDAEGVSGVLNAARALLDVATPDGTDGGISRYLLGLQVVFNVLLGRREAATELLEDMADDDSWFAARYLEAALVGLLGQDVDEHVASVRRFIEHTRSHEDVSSIRPVLQQLRVLADGSRAASAGALERLDGDARDRLDRFSGPATVEDDIGWLRRLASASDAEPELVRLAYLAELAIQGRRALEAQDWTAAIEAYRTLAADGRFPEAEAGLVTVAVRSPVLAPEPGADDALAEIVRRLTDAVPAVGGNRRRRAPALLLETWIGDLHVRLGDLPAARRMYESAMAVVGEQARHVMTARLHVGGVLWERTGLPGLEEVLHECGRAGASADTVLLGEADDLALTPADWERLARSWAAASPAARVAMLVTEVTGRAGQAWRAEGDLGKAQELLRHAYEQHRDVAGQDDPDVLARRVGLADVLREQGLIAEAVGDLREIVDARARVFGPDDAATVDAEFNLGVALLDLGDAVEAEAVLRRVAEGRARHAGTDAVETWDVRYRHAVALQALARLDEAAALYRDVLDADERLFGSDSVRALEARFQIADVQAEMGRLEEATQTLRAVVAGRIRTLGEEDPSTLAARLRHVQTLRLQDQWGEAQELTTLVESCTRVFGADDETTLAARFEAAVALQTQGLAAAAEEDFSDIHQSFLRVLGEDNTVTWDVRYRLGVVVQEQGRLAEAEEIYREVLAAELRLREPLDPSTLVTRHQIALVVGWQDRLTEAESEYRSVVADRTRVLGPDDPAVLASRYGLASVLQRQGRLDEARDEFLAVVEGNERTFGPDALDTHLARIDLAEARDQLGEGDIAVADLRTAVEGLTRTRGRDDPDTLAARSQLASTLLGCGEPREAEVEFGALADSRARSLGEDDPSTWTARYNVAFAQQQQGEWRAAEQTYREVLAAETRLLGGEDPSTLLTRVQLAFVLSRQGRYVEAAHEQRAVVEARRQTLGPTDPATLSARSDLGVILLDMDLPRDAEVEFREVAEARKAAFGADDLRTWVARFNLARALEDQQELDAAEREYRGVLAAETRLQGAEHPSTLVTREELAALLRRLGRTTEADAELRAVERIRAAQPGSGSA